MYGGGRNGKRNREIVLYYRNGKWQYITEVGNNFILQKWEIVLYYKNRKYSFILKKWEKVLYHRNGK